MATIKTLKINSRSQFFISWGFIFKHSHFSFTLRYGFFHSFLGLLKAISYIINRISIFWSCVCSTIGIQCKTYLLLAKRGSASEIVCGSAGNGGITIRVSAAVAAAPAESAVASIFCLKPSILDIRILAAFEASDDEKPLLLTVLRQPRLQPTLTVW